MLGIILEDCLISLAFVFAVHSLPSILIQRLQNYIFGELDHTLKVCFFVNLSIQPKQVVCLPFL